MQSLRTNPTTHHHSGYIYYTYKVYKHKPVRLCVFDYCIYAVDSTPRRVFSDFSSIFLRKSINPTSQPPVQGIRVCNIRQFSYHIIAIFRPSVFHQNPIYSPITTISVIEMSRHYVGIVGATKSRFF